jgi:DNA-binding phage protein
MKQEINQKPIATLETKESIISFLQNIFRDRDKKFYAHADIMKDAEVILKTQGDVDIYQALEMVKKKRKL